MQETLIPFIESALDTFKALYNFTVLDSAVGTIKAGNVVLGIVVFLIGWRIIVLLVRKLSSLILEKWIQEKDLRIWSENFIGFVLFFHLLVITLLIFGFKASIFQFIWNLTIFSVGERHVTLGKVIIGLGLLYAGMKFSHYITGVFQSLVLRRFFMEDGSAMNSLTVMFRLGLLLVIVLFVLSIVGIPLTAFTVIGGAVAIGVGLGSQNLVNNFLSGLVLMIEKPLKVDDTVEVAERHGRVEYIGPRSTRIRTEENLRLVIPNSKILEDTVVNFSLIDNYLRREIKVGVVYGSDVRKVRDLLLQVAEEHPLVEAEPEPLLLFTDFGDNSLVFKLLFWIKFKRFIQRLIIESDIRFRIDELFRENGIVIAFPQRDVHLDTLKPLEVKVLNKDKKA